MTKEIIADGKNGFIENRFGVKMPYMVNARLWNRAMDDIAKNNTWCPDIERIIYNLGERKSAKTGKNYSILTCTVFFNDNTKVVVTNSENDPVELVTKNNVTTASERSKEIALVYAIVKKIIGQPNEKGEVEGNGFGRILRELVSSGWDQKLEEKRLREEKAISKAKYLEAQKNAKPKVKRESLAKTVDRLTSVINNLDSKIASLENSNDNSPKTHKSWCQNLTRRRDAKGRFI